MTRASPHASYPLTVYFDATCPLCVAEMGAMRARDAAGRLNLVDCSPAGFAGGPAPREALMTAMHAVDAGGRVLSGVPAIRACRAAVGLPAGGFTARPAARRRARRPRLCRARAQPLPPAALARRAPRGPRRHRAGHLRRRPLPL
jgi:predicted DCC family thiol-disulfide oxidoreductase YuxK